MSFGISETGFEIKRLQDLLEENREYAVTLFQDLVQPGEFVDTSDSSLIGRIVNFAAFSDSQTWEQLGLVWSSQDPNTAVGVALDNIVQYGALSRLSPSNSTVYALFSGDIGTTIPAGSEVGFETKTDVFSTKSDVVLNTTFVSSVTLQIAAIQNTTAYSITYTTSTSSSNTVTYTSDSSASITEILNGLKSVIDSAHPLLIATIVNNQLVVDKTDVFAGSTFTFSGNLTATKSSKIGTLVALETGEISAEINTLTEIITPVLGWDSIYNPVAASLGRVSETDEELRLRFRRSKFIRATNTLDSMYSALSSLDGVEAVAVYENDTDIVDSNGVLPHSFMCVVLGGSGDQIAQNIWQNKPAGIRSQGNTTVEIIDSQGFTREINYETPTPVPIYIEIEIEADSTFPADGVDQIKTALIDYATNNLSIGTGVIRSRLFTPINTVRGHSIVSLFLDVSPSPAIEDNIEIGFTEIASFSAVNISVIEI